MWHDLKETRTFSSVKMAFTEASMPSIFDLRKRREKRGGDDEVQQFRCQLSNTRGGGGGPTNANTMGSARETRV